VSPARIADIAGILARAGIDSRVLEDANGASALVSAYGARVLAWQAAGGDNLLWVHPELAGIRSAADCDALKGGPGGLRVWFSPEWAYGWKGQPDAAGFSNYVVPPAAAAGSWRLVDSGSMSVHAETRDRIQDQIGGQAVSFSAERTVALLPAPPREAGPLEDLRYTGLSVQQSLSASAHNAPWWLDLWNILQVPRGARMLFPVKGNAVPEIYFNASGKRTWRVSSGCVEWEVEGDAETKWGLPACAVTGRLGALLPQRGGQASLLVLCHPVHGGMPYPDGPRQGYQGDQVVQSWDGFGFGEIEYHSPAASPELPVIHDSFIVWAFTGRADTVRRLASRLLEREI
jgi:hypothetical protein